MTTRPKSNTRTTGPVRAAVLMSDQSSSSRVAMRTEKTETQRLVSDPRSTWGFCPFGPGRQPPPRLVPKNKLPFRWENEYFLSVRMDILVFFCLRCSSRFQREDQATEKGLSIGDCTCAIPFTFLSPLSIVLG